MRENLFYIFLAALIFCRTSWAETFLGIKEVNPGISLTFEIAAKDTILPAPFYLPEKDTDIHVEVLAVWSDSAPAGSMVGGFVAYLTAIGLNVTKPEYARISDFMKIVSEAAHFSRS